MSGWNPLGSLPSIQSRPEDTLHIAYHEVMMARQRLPDDPARGPHASQDPRGATDPKASRRLRADAARNRAAIVAVARDVFAEQGLEAPLETIAARAGVGIATLYRRFPSREKLVAAALTEKVAAYAEVAEQALTVADPWVGFAW